jgi:hypothetical protein
LHIYYWLIHGKTYYETVIPDTFDKVKQKVKEQKSKLMDLFLDEDHVVRFRSHHGKCANAHPYLEFHQLVRDAYAGIDTSDDGQISQEFLQKHKECANKFHEKIVGLFG